MASAAVTPNALRGTTLITIASITFATSGPLAKSTLDAGISPTGVTTVRIGLAALMITAVVALIRPRALRFTRRDLPLLIGYALFGVVGAQLFFFIAVSRIPVGIAMLLEFLAPAYVALWIRFVRGTVLPRAVWLGIALAIVGLALVAEVWQGFTLDPVGVLAGLASGLSTTGYFLIGERGANTHDPLGMLAVGLLIGAVVVAVIAPPWSLPVHSFGHRVLLGGARLPVWLALLAVAVLSTAIPYLCGLFSLRHLSSAVASVLGLLEPVTATLLAWWLVCQALTPVQLAGGAILLGGAVIVQLASHRHVPPDPEPLIVTSD